MLLTRVKKGLEVAWSRLLDDHLKVQIELIMEE